MRLKKLSAFMLEHIEEPRPRAATVRRWRGACKCGGEWYMDMDVWEITSAAGAVVQTLIKDPVVARLASGR